jgi:hypothetical protein
MLTRYRYIYIYIKKQNICIKNFKMPRHTKKKFYNALFKERFKDSPMKQGHVLTLQLHQAEDRTF